MFNPADNQEEDKFQKLRQTLNSPEQDAGAAPKPPQPPQPAQPMAAP